jgi:hypothetical protein
MSARVGFCCGGLHLFDDALSNLLHGRAGGVVGGCWHRASIGTNFTTVETRSSNEDAYSDPQTRIR